MKKNNYHVVGVMSGTSLDGVDLAALRFFINNGKWSFEIGVCETVPYTENWVKILQEAINYSPNQLGILNKDYTHLLGGIIREFIVKNALQNIDAVCTHGHTILHQPDKGYTLQIGNLPDIAALANQNVVCDFRVQDVQLGGQGAPLVPIGDRLLFAEYEYCLNLGGFSNISFEENGERMAYDICPVNTVLNFYSQKLGFEFDKGGQLARHGMVCEELLSDLNSIAYYDQNYPKSLGFEFVKDVVFPLINSYKVPEKDVLRTFVEHIAIQISKNVSKRNSELLITGGGVYNDFLIERIKFWCNGTNVKVPAKNVIEFKEALIFGFLGILRLRNEVNVLASVTGAAHDHCSGNIFLQAI